MKKTDIDWSIAIENILEALQESSSYSSRVHVLIKATASIIEKISIYSGINIPETLLRLVTGSEAAKLIKNPKDISSSKLLASEEKCSKLYKKFINLLKNDINIVLQDILSAECCAQYNLYNKKCVAKLTNCYKNFKDKTQIAARNEVILLNLSKIMGKEIDKNRKAQNIVKNYVEQWQSTNDEKQLLESTILLLEEFVAKDEARWALTATPPVLLVKSQKEFSKLFSNECYQTLARELSMASFAIKGAKPVEASVTVIVSDKIDSKKLFSNEELAELSTAKKCVRVSAYKKPPSKKILGKNQSLLTINPTFHMPVPLSVKLDDEKILISHMPTDLVCTSDELRFILQPLKSVQDIEIAQNISIKQRK
ncbi:hypothetical protein CAXC1_20022 [Candidatus Xenohaliotis californiensis]|uniref:Uncharacterized protein n=1 Tax=Candidatus Xenohaliotis californiensis TaxID=84677 RepID=A0ABM9N855_9RICK|nr:hypothetical protein CAXC1_20022 [Candidatus Xenohaliotis californiensis]